MSSPLSERSACAAYSGAAYSGVAGARLDPSRGRNNLSGDDGNGQRQPITDHASSIPRRYDVVPRLWRGGAALAAALVCGWLTGEGRVSTLVVASVVAVAVLLAVGRRNGGVGVGVLALVALNGIPGLDISKHLLAGRFRLSDGAVFLLVIGLGYRIYGYGNAGGPTARRLARWGLAFAAWWLIVFARSYLIAGIPLMKAFLFGRDFLYFAILLPLIAMGLRGRSELYGCIGTLAAGAVVYSIGEIAISAAHVSDGFTRWFVHNTSTGDFGDVTRVFATMGDTLAPALAFGLGLALLPPRVRFARRIGIALVLLALVATIYSLTRALYIGAAVGFIVTAISWIRAGEATSRARRTLGMLCAVLVVVIVALDYRALTQPIGAASSRAALTLTEFEHKTGNIGYRYHLDQQMLDVLGSSWVGGLGFLHPDSHPVAGLPNGSIRNSDVGVMNVLMTMGAIGTVLLYLAPVSILVSLMRRWRRLREPARGRVEWLIFGCTMWLIVDLVTSISLVTFFSLSGLVLSAVLLATVVRLVDEVAPPA